MLHNFVAVVAHSAHILSLYSRSTPYFIFYPAKIASLHGSVLIFQKDPRIFLPKAFSFDKTYVQYDSFIQEIRLEISVLSNIFSLDF